MSKKPRVRTLVGSQHVKGSKTMLRSAQHIFVMFFDDFEKKPARKILSLNSISNLQTFS